MKKYVLVRLVKSIISIIAVVAIVIVMVFTLIPEKKVFDNDTAHQKLKGNLKVNYEYNKLEELGYLDYLNVAEMCRKYSDDTAACSIQGSEENSKVLSILEDKGYTIVKYAGNDQLTGTSVAYRRYKAFELVANFYKNLIKIDHPWVINDPKNPDLKRGYSIEKDYNGLPAVVCSGCKNKYQFYLDSSFPFIHSNLLKFNFGVSHPVNSGIPTIDVVSVGQGKSKSFEQTFPTGAKQSSPILQHTCRYKYEVDHLDMNKFNDNYADCQLKYESPSMIGTSYIFGLSSLFLAYLIAIPFAIAMARNKGKFVDKFGIFYINLLISVPSLALIFFIKYIGFSFNLPDKFPQLGFNDIKSYILPVIILAMLNTPSLMMWLRRYMVDQGNADYVKFAKAKGLSAKEISQRHILKNAIVPLVNGIPSSIILTISGAFMTESVFSIPGMGKMLPDSITVLNNNMIITLTFIFTALSIFAVFFGDILMTFVDPRISLNIKKGDQ